jgi:hypothetical protein
MLVREMGTRMEQNINLMSPDQMMRSWMAVGGQAQDAFMKMMTSAASGAMKGFSGE